MSAVALLLALATPSEPAPERAMLDSLKGACDRAGAMDEMKADAAASGWQPIPEEADPRVAKLTKLGRDAVGSEAKISGATYKRRVGERDLFLILSRYEDPTGFWGAGCRLYDFSATAPLDAAILESWMGRAPTGVQTPGGGLVRHLWEPAWRSGLTVEVTHVPQGNPLGEAFGLSGNVLTAQAIGGF